MTIAACYVSAEGVVLGADSTSTVYVPGPPGVEGSTHHFDFAQKVFEFGEDSSIGIVTWGLGSLKDTSHRTVIAEVADTCNGDPGSISSVEQVARRFAEHFHRIYTTRYEDVLRQARQLRDKGDERTQEEDNDYERIISHLPAGFCLGGWWPGQRSPAAFEVFVDPLAEAPPDPKPIPQGVARFWGCPNLMDRLILGLDYQVFHTILASGKWHGTAEELLDTIDPNRLAQPFDLPIREAIDWIHASIYTTIKVMKFSHLPPVCGGVVEVAVVTSDRKFRWVSHKRMSEAIPGVPALRKDP